MTIPTATTSYAPVELSSRLASLAIDADAILARCANPDVAGALARIVRECSWAARQIQTVPEIAVPPASGPADADARRDPARTAHARGYRDGWTAALRDGRPSSVATADADRDALMLLWERERESAKIVTGFCLALEEDDDELVERIVASQAHANAVDVEAA